MRKLFYLMICLIVFACGSKNTDQTNVAIAKAVTTSAPAKIVPASTVLDSIKPKPKRSRYVATDPARPKSEINQSYPYDITLKDASGKDHLSSDILKKNGKPTVVLFWMTTCFPCRIEMKAIQKVVDDWKAESDFNIVAISTDFSKNYESFVKLVNENNWSFDAYMDTNREFRKVIPGALNGLPQSFIFDKNGEIVYHKRKYSTGDEHKLYEKVKELIEKDK